MSFTQITKPNQGDPTRKPLIDAVIDNLDYLYSVIGAMTAQNVLNGSFELFENDGSQDIPSNWTKAPSGNGGSFTMTGEGRADTECRHGKCAVKMTSPGGASNGGYTLETTDYFEVSPLRPLFVSFLHKASVATIRNKVVLTWYTSAFTSISTTEVYTSVTNPTSWQHLVAWTLPPATARYAKLKLVGADSSVTVAGSAYFDDVRFGQPEFRNTLIVDQAGSYKWAAPSDCSFVLAMLVGGGGGGGYGNGQGGGGGASGALCFGALTVVAATDYDLVVGAGGTAGTGGGNGGNATASTFSNGTTTLSAGGGNGGGSGGTGNTTPGTASGGHINTAGGNGGNNVGQTGGYGGYLAELGLRPARSGNGVAGPAGTKVKWGTGGGGGGNGANGGVGSDGMVILFIP